MIQLKTAELFEVACRLGAKVAGYPVEFSEAASLFGRHVGIAYQIFDDLVDLYADESMIGKTLGTDLDKGKFTLPLLLLLEKLPEDERESACSPALRRVTRALLPTSPSVCTTFRFLKRSWPNLKINWQKPRTQSRHSLNCLPLRRCRRSPRWCALSLDGLNLNGELTSFLLGVVVRLRPVAGILFDGKQVDP